MKLDGNTSVTKLQKIARKRFSSVDSESRRKYFEDLCALVTREDVNLEFADHGSMVSFDHDKRKIYISRGIPDTEYDEDLWSFLFQKSMCYHESAHVLYTDGDELFDYADKWEKNLLRDEFERVHNIIEDIYIESAISEVYNVRDDFDLVNGVLSEKVLDKYPQSMDLHQVIDAYLTSFIHENGLLDERKKSWNFSFYDEQEIFFNEVKPYIDVELPKCLEVTDPKKRVHAISDFFEGLSEYYEVDEDTPDRKGRSPTSSGSAKRDGEEQESPDVELKPDSSQDIDSHEIEQEIMEVNRDDEREDPDDSLGKWKDASGDGAGMDVPIDSRERDMDQWEREAETFSRTFERYLKNQLILERKTEKRKKLRSGRLDSRSIPRAYRGNSNVFYRNREPDEKDYVAAILLDQSGSMGTMETEAAVKASGAASFAFDEVGIDNCIVSIYGNENTLLKDFSETPKNSELFVDRSGGGTPLTQGLEVCRERLKHSGSHPFILVVTDGMPDQRQTFLNEVRSTNMPVLGVYLDDGREDYSGHAKNFHRLEVCEAQGVFDGLQRLVSRSVI